MLISCHFYTYKELLVICRLAWPRY